VLDDQAFILEFYSNGLKRIVFENPRDKTFVVYTEMDAASKRIAEGVKFVE